MNRDIDKEIERMFKAIRLAVMAGLGLGFLYASVLAQEDASPKELSAKVAIEAASEPGRFQFQNVPVPSASDAGAVAKWSVVAGRPDVNSASVTALFDGALPENTDQPSRNFFFDRNGGCLLLEWDQAKTIQSVQLYSQHPGERLQQHYRVFVPESDQDLNELKKRLMDAKANVPPAEMQPEQWGWRRWGEVSSQGRDIKVGPVASQLSVGDAEQGQPGATRALLVQLLNPSPDQRHGSTFVSELDVRDGQEYPLPEVTAQVDQLVIEGGYEITFDTSDLPEIRPWVNQHLKPVCQEWYPRIVEMLSSQDYQAPKSFTIFFHRNMDGVAHTAGRDVHCAGVWFMRQLNGEAKGAVVHELVHVVQQYRQRRRGMRNPGWMVEGLADYIRWFLYEDEGQRPSVNFRRANYDDSYRTSAAFLNFVIQEHGKDRDLLREFNAAMREGRYSEELWEQWTGKTPAALWEEFRQSTGKSR